MDMNQLYAQNQAHFRTFSPGPDNSGLIGGVEKIFRDLNLNTPLMRSVVVGGAAAAIMFAAQPSVFFHNGSPRPWAVLVEEGQELSAPPTTIPWYVVVVGCGLAAGLFV